MALPIALMLATGGLIALLALQPSRHADWARGEVTRAYFTGAEIGSGASYAEVRLDEGGLARVRLPAGAVLGPHQRVILDVRTHERPPYRLSYRFERLEEAASH